MKWRAAFARIAAMVFKEVRQMLRDPGDRKSVV